jgi:hypothetical protein
VSLGLLGAPVLFLSCCLRFAVWRCPVSSMPALSPAQAPAPRWAACSARLAALSGRRALVGALLRPSPRSYSGWVLAVSFSSPAVASSFARAWSGRLGLPCFVRPAPGAWVVSVPVAPPASAGPVVLPWRGPGGGPAAFWRALAGAGC